MTDETADVLEQDGPTQENAEESKAAEPEKVGEQEPQATQEQGDDEGHKRLGGWQRKIQKLERELEVWREQALKPQTAKPAPTTELSAPEPPDLETFGGTMQEFKAAQKKWAEDHEKYIDQKRERENQQKQVETAVRTFGERLKKLPDADKVNEAFADLEVSRDLKPFLDVELAKLKNGAEVFREIMLDADSREELEAFDKAKDGMGIKTLLLSVSRSLRIAQRNADPEPAQTRAPKPATPLRKTSSTDTELHDGLHFDEYVRRRNLQAKKSASG